MRRCKRNLELLQEHVPELSDSLARRRHWFWQCRRWQRSKSAGIGHHFAHESERMFAALLDSCHITWLYEPCTFPVEWNDDGSVKTAFSPDFYIPEQDLFIELTVMKQSLVTKKNRKARLCRVKYGLKIHIVYRSAFEALIGKAAL